jgi:pyrimidine-nucleoside phosphorylase
LALVQAQGGDVAALINGLPIAPQIAPVIASSSGFVAGLEARQVAEAALHLGAGRRRKGEDIDFGVGIVVKKKIGQWVEAGEPWAEIYSRGQGETQARALLNKAFSISEDSIKPPALILGQVGL